MHDTSSECFFYKCMKFRWNISNVFQVIERTRFVTNRPDRPTYRRMNGRNVKSNMSPNPSRGRHNVGKEIKQPKQQYFDKLDQFLSSENTDPKLF